MLKKIGVLALQGGVIEHINLLKKIPGIKPIPIKKASELNSLAGLIIPGGESTSISKLLTKSKMITPIQELGKKGLPIWGTCAGLILLAQTIEGNTNNFLSLIDINVKRNAFGSQLASFIIKKEIPAISPKPIELVFIRSPIITSTAKDVQILAKINGKIVAAQKKNILVTSFHPELTNNPIVHKYFVEKVNYNNK